MESTPRQPQPTMQARPPDRREPSTGHGRREIRIGAEDGAYRKRWLSGGPNAHLNPKIQVNWFTAACHAVERTGLKGI